MTLPTNINLPNIPKESEEFKYFSSLQYALKVYLQQTNVEVNGTYLSYTDSSPGTYAFISGSSSAGDATYSNTQLFTQRVLLLTHVWFDITWSDHTGTGNLLVNVPYASQIVTQNPFVGVIESDGLTFDVGYTYLVGNLIPNTTTIEIRECGSGVSSQPLAIPSSGTLRGSIVYAGQQFI